MNQCLPLSLFVRWPFGGRVLLAKLFVGVALFFLLSSLHGQTASEESIESLLAPPAAASAREQMAAPEPEAPKLPREMLAPSPHLPGIPGWFALLILVLIFIPLGLILFVALKKTNLTGLAQPRMNPFAEARRNLLALRSLPAETPLAELSTRISIVVRKFLTDSKSDSALYQTREEFLTDRQRLHHVLEPAKGKTADFLGELASLQYAPPRADPQQVGALIDKGLRILDLLAQPESAESGADTTSSEDDA